MQKLFDLLKFLLHKGVFENQKIISNHEIDNFCKTYFFDKDNYISELNHIVSLFQNFSDAKNDFSYQSKLRLQIFNKGKTLKIEESILISIFERIRNGNNGQVSPLIKNDNVNANIPNKDESNDNIIRNSDKLLDVSGINVELNKNEDNQVLSNHRETDSEQIIYQKAVQETEKRINSEKLLKLEQELQKLKEQNDKLIKVNSQGEIKIKYCKKCGKKVNTSMKFCNNCGTKIN